MAAEPPHTPPTVDLGLAAISVPANESLLIDIVLVHGLNGTRSTTWTSRQNEFWPSWIVEDFPGARVWVYGYNSSVWLSSSRDHLIVHAIKFLEELASHRVGQRKAGSAQCIPIVMVGHSLGGILIKQALYHASNTLQKFTYIFNATVAICFCGTPHRGSVWANRLYAMSLSHVPAFVKLLRRRKPYSLSTIAERFNNVWGAKKVLTFQETQGVPMLGLIVRPSDSVTNCSSEKIYRIDKDHREMVKVENREEDFYRILVSELRALAHDQPPIHELPDNISEPENRRPSPQGCSGSTWAQKRLWKELCEGGPWETRIYPSGEVEFGTEDHSAGIKPEEFLGGSFYYQYPPGSDTCVLFIADLTTWRFSWSITSPMSMYYPGRHTGIINLPPGYPMERNPFPRWTSPILSPYVSKKSGALSPACGPWRDVWGPSMTIHKFTSSFAAIIHYGPVLENFPRDLGIELYHPLNPAVDNPLYMTSEVWFRLATNFFCRAYILSNDTEEEEEEADSPATEEMCSTSAKAIKGLIQNTLKFEEVPPYLCPPERAGMTVEESFALSRIKTRKGWVEEERLWADSLDKHYGVQKPG